MAGRQCDDLHSAIDENRWINQKCVTPFFNKGRKGGIDLAAGAGPKELDLPPQCRTCRLRVWVRASLKPRATSKATRAGPGISS